MEYSQLERLIQASRTGDRESFGRLVSAHQARVCSVTYSVTGDVAQSEDLAQEAFVTAWQRLEDLRELQKFPSWLCGIARNLARKALHRQRRDPLAQSRLLADHHPVDQESVPDKLVREERERLLWDALGTIPETYREPLVIFYREGRSVRSIAESLDITEQCAKQRLSRGRGMLKAKVAQTVEETLEHTRPGTAFTVALIAGLPALSAQATAAGTAAVASKGAALGGKASVIAASASAGALGGLLGTVVGMAGGFVGMWMGIRNCPTLRLWRYTLKFSGWVNAFVWAFLGCQGVFGALFWGKPAVMWSCLGVIWVLYVPALVGLVLFTKRAYERILDEDIGQRPAPTSSLEDSVLSRACLWRSFFWSTSFAVLGSVGCVVWVASIPAVQPYWIAAAVAFLLCHMGFLWLFRWGMRIAYDQASFETYRSAEANVIDAATSVTDSTCPRCGSTEAETMWKQARILALLILAIVVVDVLVIAILALHLRLPLNWYGAPLLLFVPLGVGLGWGLLRLGRNWKRCRQCHTDFGCEYRSKITLRGLPLICVASWKNPATGKKWQCKGIIAAGDLPVGILAIGAVPVGILAIGGMPFGVISIGGLAFGGLSLAGVAIGVVGVGGMAIAPVLAYGGLAVGGVLASGGVAPGTVGPEAAIAESATERVVLENGLTVLLRPIPEADQVSVEAFYRVGFLHEPKGMTQAAHLLEHLVCNAETKSFKQNEAMKRLNRLGMANAETLPDWTHYDYILPSDKLELALRIEAERLTSLRIGKDIVAVEASRCYKETDFVEQNPAAGMVKHAFMAFNQAWRHGMKTALVRGGMDGFRIDDLAAFHREFYRPDNLTLILVGGIKPDHALKLIETHLGGLRPAEAAPQGAIDWSKIPARTTVTWDAKVRSVCIAFPPPSKHSDRVVLSLMGSVLAQKLMTDPQITAVANSVFCSNHLWSVGELPFFVYAAAKADASLQEVERVLTTRVQQIATSTPDDALMQMRMMTVQLSQQAMTQK